MQLSLLQTSVGLRLSLSWQRSLDLQVVSWLPVKNIPVKNNGCRNQDSVNDPSMQKSKPFNSLARRWNHSSFNSPFSQTQHEVSRERLKCFSSTCPCEDNTHLCQTILFYIVTWPLLIPVLKLPLPFGTCYPSPPFTLPKWLSICTHCNWRSNVH